MEHPCLIEKKTMHILCIALRVYDQGKIPCDCKIIGTLPTVSVKCIFFNCLRGLACHTASVFSEVIRSLSKHLESRSSHQ